jgi:hypothetical protein
MIATSSSGFPLVGPPFSLTVDEVGSRLLDADSSQVSLDPVASAGFAFMDVADEDDNDPDDIGDAAAATFNCRVVTVVVVVTGTGFN